MVQEDFLPQLLVTHVGVDLGGAEVGMAEKRLDDAEVRAALEERCGKGVAEGVGRDSLLDAGELALFLDHDEDHHSCEVVATAVEEDIVLFAGLDLHLPAVVEPEVQFLYGFVADGHEAFLVALAEDADEVLVEIEVGELEVGELRDTQAAREEHLDDGAVAVALLLREIHAGLELVHLLSGEKLRQVLWQLWRLKQLRGVHLKVSVELEVMVEVAYAAEDARLALCRETMLVERRGKVLQVLELHAEDVEVVVREVVEQPAQVVLVSLEGVLAVAALELQVTHVALDDVGCRICLYSHDVWK